MEQFQETIRDPTRVPLAVRQAQDKALSIRPSTEPLKTASVFSRNVVVLEITGPQVTDLTLIDLPGIIQSPMEGQDPGNPGLVRDLVKSNIARKSTLILLVVTMAGELEFKPQTLKQSPLTHR